MTKTPYLRALFKSPDLFVAVLNPEGKLIDANKTALNFIDCELKDLKGNKFWDTPWWNHSKQLQAKLKEGIEAAIRGEKTRFEADHFSPEGNRVKVDFVLQPVKMKEASTKLLALGTDITDRIRANKELERSESKFRAIAEQAHDGIFIHSDDKILWVNDRLSEIIGYSSEEIYKENPMDFLHPEDRDKVKGIAERRVAGEDVPSTYEARLVREDGEVRDCEFAVTRIEYNGTQAFLGAVRDITERRKAEEEVRQSEQKLRQSFIELAETTSRVLGVRDPYTREHEQRVAELAEEVGRKMGLEEDKLLGLYIGGVLHDIGKIAIPETILTKPGELKDVEWKLIRSHPKVGYDQILADTDFPWPVAEMTLHHHERLDGSGYPDGLKGNELSLEVRILGAVDVVEAMSTRRPYREARSKEQTLEVLKEGKGDKFDPEVVDVLFNLIDRGIIEFGEK